LIPHPFVDHTHADALVTLMNTPRGEERVRDLYGDDVAVVPYRMPGFRLARACAQRLPGALGPGTLGVVLLRHGLFTFGETAWETYERMIGLVTRAEEALVRAGAWNLPLPGPLPVPTPLRELLAGLRLEVSGAAGRPMILTCLPDPEALAFARRGNVAEITSRGPATPDHVIYTRRVPLVGRDVAGYAEEYRREFADYARTLDQPPTMLDPAPRVILDPIFGLAAAGRTAREAGIALDLYRHTLRMILRAERLERWEALPARDLFEMEYWELEQAKLAAAGPPPPLAGTVVLATGVGGEVVQGLLALGAAVVAMGGGCGEPAPREARLEVELGHADTAGPEGGV
ncbi:MAG: class II aldolase/adducin family protein, partial [Deinococcus sp.]